MLVVVDVGKFLFLVMLLLMLYIVSNVLIRELLFGEIKNFFLVF